MAPICICKEFNRVTGRFSAGQVHVTRGWSNMLHTELLLPRTCRLCGTLCDCVPCYISILQLLTTVTSWEQTHSSRWCTVLIFYKKVSLSLLSFRISISHSWRAGCWEAEKHSLQNISSNGIPDPLKLHICCNYFLIAHLNPHHHICSELCYDSGTRNLIGDEIT